MPNSDLKSLIAVLDNNGQSLAIPQKQALGNFLKKR